MMKQSKTTGKIGIISGAGPEAGIDLWRKILTHNKFLFGYRFQGDVSAPEILVHSVPELGLSIDIEAYESILWESLQQSLQSFSGRVDFVCLASNVLHYFEDRIQEQSLNFEFISMIAATEDAIASYNQLALLALSKVIDFGNHSPYRNAAKKFNIEVPSPIEMDILIRSIKVNGADHPNTIDLFEDILSDIKSENVILGCAELPLLPLHQFKKNFIDPSDLLAKRVAEHSYHARLLRC